MNTQSNEPDPDAIIEGLHRIRESIVESFGGDLHALTNDAQQRQKRSGRTVWRGKKSVKPLPLNNDVLPSNLNNPIPLPGER